MDEMRTEEKMNVGADEQAGRYPTENMSLIGRYVVFRVLEAGCGPLPPLAVSYKYWPRW